MAPMMVGCSFIGEEVEEKEEWGEEGGGCCGCVCGCDCQRARRAMERDGQLRGSEKNDFW